MIANPKMSRVRPGRGVFFATCWFSSVLGLGGTGRLARVGGRGALGVLEVLHTAYDDLARHREHGAGRHLDLGPRLAQRANGPEDPRGEDDFLADLEVLLELLDLPLLAAGRAHHDGPEADHRHEDHEQLRVGRHVTRLQYEGTGSLGAPTPARSCGEVRSGTEREV